MNLQDIIFQKINRNGYKTDDCWLWTGALSSKGVPRLTHNKKSISVMKVIFEWFRGDVPKDHRVYRSCDNAACVNPGHLITKTFGQHCSERLKEFWADMSKDDRKAFIKKRAKNELAYFKQRRKKIKKPVADVES